MIGNDFQLKKLHDSRGSMALSAIKLPYLRPQSLSDPFDDYTPDILATLLATPDRDLKWGDFQCVLGPFLPAGAYEESAYFLPLAFGYLLEHDEDAMDVVTSVVWFASEYAPQLKRDGALGAVRARLQHCMQHWTGEFDIHHSDREACRKLGATIEYFDYVWHSEIVMEAANDLIRFEAHADLAYAFFADLAAAESDPVKSAWFLESARAHLSDDLRRPPQQPGIVQPLENQQLVRKHAATVRDKLPSFDETATYWRDTFNVLGVSAAE